MFTVLAALLLGVIEGLTEFLPVSSTGHMILASHGLGWHGPQVETFEIFIQLGAILAVVRLYKQRFYALWPTSQQTTGFAGVRGLWLLGLTTLPALIFGFLVHGYMKTYLFNAYTVALGLGLGGVAILVVERWFIRPQRSGLDTMLWRDALIIGLFQCLALWPGVSRSAATILGGMLIGIERKTATEYSFLAAVPVMCAAVGYDLLKSLTFLTSQDIPIFALGFVVAFLSAWVAVQGFVRLLNTYTLMPFGWYRIVVALVVLVFLR